MMPFESLYEPFGISFEEALKMPASRLWLMCERFLSVFEGISIDDMDKYRKQKEVPEQLKDRVAKVLSKLRGG